MEVLYDKAKTKKKIKTRLIICAALAAILTALLLLKRSEAVCEFFATTVSRGWIWFTGHIFGVIPLSLYELLLIFGIVAAVFLLVRIIALLFRKKALKALCVFLGVAVFGLSLGTLYAATASFAYNREPLALPFYDKKTDGELTKDDAVKIADYLVSEMNALSEKLERDENGVVKCPYSFDELAEKMKEEYKRLNGNGYFSSYTPTAKKILNKRIMSEMKITGVFFAPFGEANVNGNELDCNLPVTMAHELAHSKGVMREDDANLTAYYVTLTSDDDYIKYCGLYNVYYRMINAVSYFPNSRDDSIALSGKVADEIKAEESYEIKYWSEFSLLSDFSNFLNDIYLKLSGSEEGTGSYGDSGIIIDTGEKDDYDRPIYSIVSYSPVQKLIIKLYLNGEI